MRLILAAALAALPACAWAHTRSSDPASVAGPAHHLIACNGQDATAAINAALASGGITHLSAGTCLVSGGLTMTVSGSILNGAGAGNTIIRSTAPATFAVIAVGTGIRSQAPQNVAMWAFTVDGAATAGATTPALDDIAVRSGASAAIVSVEAMHSADNGVRFAGSGSIVHSYIHDNQHNGIYVEGVAQPGHPVFNAGPVAIIGNRVANNSLERETISSAGVTWDGIDCDPWHTGCDIERNIVVGKDILLLDHSTATWSGGDRIIGNTVIDSNEAGIDVADHIDGFTITGNTLIHDLTNSIVVGGAARNGTISGNTVSGGGGPVIVHLGTSAVVAAGNVTN